MFKKENISERGRQMAYQEFGRGTAGILTRVRALCEFARRYPYADLLLARTGAADMGAAVGALIAACDLLQLADNNPWETDAIAPGTSPEDVEGGE